MGALFNPSTLDDDDFCRFVSIEDPFDQDDWESYTAIQEKMGDKIQIVLPLRRLFIPPNVYLISSSLATSTQEQLFSAQAAVGACGTVYQTTTTSNVYEIPSYTMQKKNAISYI